MTQAYPLHWPKDWPRTKNPGDSRFDTSLTKAMNNVEDSLRRFSDDSSKKIENLVISSNYSLTDLRPADSGVAIYFTWDGINTCVAVDRYKKIEDNLQAIYHCIEAERTKLRHGGLNLVRAAFRGYAALPPPSNRPERKKPMGKRLSGNTDTGTPWVKLDTKSQDNGSPMQHFVQKYETKTPELRAHRLSEYVKGRKDESN